MAQPIDALGGETGRPGYPGSNWPSRPIQSSTSVRAKRFEPSSRHFAEMAEPGEAVQRHSQSSWSTSIESRGRAFSIHELGGQRVAALHHVDDGFRYPAGRNSGQGTVKASSERPARSESASGMVAA